MIVLAEKYYVDSGEGYNFHFSDDGLFGLRVTGDASNVKLLFLILFLYRQEIY